MVKVPRNYHVVKSPGGGDGVWGGGIGWLMVYYVASMKTAQMKKLRSCVQVEMAVLGSPSLIFFMVSVDAKQHLKKVRSCVKVEVAVLGSPSLIFFMVSVDAKQHLKKVRSCVKVEVAVLGSCP